MHPPCRKADLPEISARPFNAFVEKQDDNPNETPQRVSRGHDDRHADRRRRAGVHDRVVTGLPSSRTTPDTGSFVSGVADVAFIGDTLYSVIDGNL